MEQNLFEALKKRKENILRLIRKATEFGWINTESAEYFNNKIDNDTLTIGVIGQMKCGKSTFLNSFVFEDTVLPAATTPMTAALSIITYGEEKKIKAEFYTADEWAEQQLQAKRSLEEAQGNAAEESKIKAAKELVSKAEKLGSALNGLLGKTTEDSFDNLIEYVGADGKYISITKSVTIYYPKDYLKGVEIVDTPGFNDPIVSREERTKEFLKKADVVLMMLYAGRPFDAIDRDIIFKNVRQSGIGKVLIGINKYDIPFCNETNPEDENQIKDYVINEIKKACRVCGDNTLNEILMDTTPIPLSAEMALLSMLPMTKIAQNESLNFAWNRHCKNFGISTQTEMRSMSHIEDLTSAIKTMVNNEKDKILFAKPINAIMAAGSTLETDIEKQIQLLSSEIEMLEMPNEELEELESKLNKAHRKLSKKIESLGDDMEAEIRNIIRKGKNQLEDDVDSACNKMRSIVDNEWGRFNSFESIRPKLDAEIDKLSTRTLKRSVESLAENAKRSIDRCISDFFADVEDVLMKYVPDFDSRSFVKKIKNQVMLEVTDKDLFSAASNDESDDEYGVLDFVGDFFNRASFGVLGGIFNALSHGSEKAKVHSVINDISAEFDPTPYLEAAMKQRDNVITFVTKAFISELIDPLQEQVTNILTQKGDKDKRLANAKESLASFTEQKKTLKEQFSTLEQMKKNLHTNS